MLKSMTGFGRSEKQNGVYVCKAEVRSVNNRFMDINVRLPKYLLPLEAALKKLVKSQCTRGSFDLYVSVEKSDGAVSEVEIKPNLALAAQYFEAFNQVRQSLGLAEEISIDTILCQKDIVKAEPPSLDEGRESIVLETVEDALSGLVAMRVEEGRALEEDLRGHITAIAGLVAGIKERQPTLVTEYKNRLDERVKTLTEGIELDASRLEQETAILADRSDISEEITRLESHLSQFQQLLGQNDPIGRKLEFITQEINRETNTIGSKSMDYQISHWVIEIKSILEKIREQLQNVE